MAWNDFLSSEGFAWSGTIIAALFFGSNYVVAKKFPTGDGFAFQWFMAIGILLVSWPAIWVGGEPFVWEYSGLLGGALWACGNLMVPTIIKYVGLGIGFLLWCIVNLLVGWLIGTFGLFGVAANDIENIYLNVAGALVGVLSIFVYVFIKPTLEDPQGAPSPLEATVNGVESYDNHFEEESEKISKGVQVLDAPVGFEKYKRIISENKKRIIGTCMGLFAGVLYGLNLTPFEVWYANTDIPNANPMMYVFSYYSGIFLTSTIAFVIYVIYKRNRPQIFPESIIPSIVCGAMWGIASSCFMTANGVLGPTIGFPIIVVGPMIVSSLWSVFLFKEIQGKKNLILLVVAIGLNILCVALTVLSDIKF